MASHPAEPIDDDDDDNEREQKPIDVPAEMSRDMMLLRMDHESIRAAAQLKPRNNALILKELLAIIDAYPAAADEAIYSKPVGTVWAIKCGKCGNRFESADQKAECPKCGSEGHNKDEARRIKKYAENLSIRAAETIRSIYGANSLRIASEELPDGKMRLSGTFVDYATATMTSDERIVSPWYKKKHGGMERIAEDRFLNLTVKAEKAKLRRDLILDAVPAILKAAYRDACEKKIVATVTAGYIEEQILPFLPSIGLNVADAETIIGKPRSMGWTNEDVATLRKVCAGLKNGEITKAELFAELADVREQAAVDTGGPGRVIDVPKDGQANASDLSKPKGEKTSRPGRKKTEPVTTAGPDPEYGDVEPPLEPKAPAAEEPKPKQEETPKPSTSGLFGTDVNEDEPLDQDMMDATKDRIEACQTVADCNTAEAELKRLKMSVHQRAVLMGLLQRVRQDRAKK